MMKHFELWCAATRRVLQIEACLYFKTPLDSFCSHCNVCGILPQRTHTVAVHGGLQCFFEIPWSRRRFTNTCPWYMLAKHWNSTKATSNCDCGKGILGLPLFHHNSALHLRAICPFIVLFDCILQHLLMVVSTTSGLPHNSAVILWCRDDPGCRRVLLAGVMLREVTLGSDKSVPQHIKYLLAW